MGGFCFSEAPFHELEHQAGAIFLSPEPIWAPIGGVGARAHQNHIRRRCRGAGGTEGTGELRGEAWLRRPWAVAGPGCGARGRWQRLAAAPVGGGRTWLRHPWAVAGPGCGARGRWQRLAAAPVGGGRAWLRHPWTVAAPGCGARRRWQGLAAAPVDGGRAWPDNESTRRAKLAARTTRGRAAAHGAARPHCRIRRRPEHQRSHRHKHRHKH